MQTVRGSWDAYRVSSKHELIFRVFRRSQSSPIGKCQRERNVECGLSTQNAIRRIRPYKRRSRLESTLTVSRLRFPVVPLRPGAEIQMTQCAFPVQVVGKRPTDSHSHFLSRFSPYCCDCCSKFCIKLLQSNRESFRMTLDIADYPAN